MADERADVESWRNLARVAVARQREEADRERDAQVAAGQMSLVPFPRIPSKPFRSELVIEQNSIFVSTQFKGDFFTYEREARNPDTGEPVLRRLTVGKVDNVSKKTRGVLTHIHQDAFYKLLKLWEERGSKVGIVDGRAYACITTTAYEVVTALGGSDSRKDYVRIHDILWEMAAIPITLENVHTWQGMQDKETFSLLNEVRWMEQEARPGSKADSKSEVRVLFSSFMTESFLRKQCKTLLLGPYTKLSGKGLHTGVAKLLYPFLDAQLSTKDEYHATLDSLAERFGLQRYEYKTRRRHQFSTAIRALNGSIIRAGSGDGSNYVLQVALGIAQDESDYVLLARKGDKLPAEMPLVVERQLQLI